LLSAWKPPPIASFGSFEGTGYGDVFGEARGEPSHADAAAPPVSGQGLGGGGAWAIERELLLEASARRKAPPVKKE
jgi:hypothetical protein